MKDKKGMEMAISTVIVLVLALVLLAVGIYIIYSKIYKPSEIPTSLITCKARGGEEIDDCGSCTGTCAKLPRETSSELKACCFREK